MSNRGRLEDGLRGLFIFYFSPCLKTVYHYHHLSKLCRKIGYGNADIHRILNVYLRFLGLLITTSIYVLHKSRLTLLAFFYFHSISLIDNGIQMKIQGVKGNERSKVIKERYHAIDFRSIQISTRILTLTCNLIFIP